MAMAMATSEITPHDQIPVHHIAHLKTVGAYLDKAPGAIEGDGGMIVFPHAQPDEGPGLFSRLGDGLVVQHLAKPSALGLGQQIDALDLETIVLAQIGLGLTPVELEIADRYGPLGNALALLSRFTRLAVAASSSSQNRDCGQASSR